MTEAAVTLALGLTCRLIGHREQRNAVSKGMDT